MIATTIGQKDRKAAIYAGVFAIFFGVVKSGMADYPETVLADEPQLYFRFEEDDGSASLQDSSGNEHHSEDFFDVLLEEEGAIGRAAGFEGFGSVLTGLTLDPSEGDFTIELFVKPYEIAGTQVMVSNQDGFGTGRSNLLLSTAGEINSFVGGSTSASGAFAEADVWYHVVLTYDADDFDTMRFYIDGEEADGTGTNLVEGADGNWVIGSHKSQGSQFTNAVLDEVAIYNYRLDDPDGDDDTSDSRVQAHYQEYLRETLVIADFSIDKEFVNAGEAATLSWVVGDVEILAIDNGIGDVLPLTTDGAGSVEVMPTETTTYVLSGEGPAGEETAEVTIQVNSPPTIDTFTGSATELVIGQTLTLNWATTNADEVTITPGIGTVAASGTMDVEVTGDVTFTLTAMNPNATVTAEVSVTTRDGDPSLVARWSVGEAAGETAGTVLISGVSADHNATFTETPTWVTTDLAPTSTIAAVEFDGLTYAEAAAYDGVTGPAERTIAFWLKGEDLQNPNATIVSWGNTANTTRWGVRVGGSLNIRTEVAGSGSEGTAEIIDGEWHHVAVVLANDGSPNIEDIQFFVDGEPDPLTIVGGTDINTGAGTNVRIGGSAAFTGREFTGQLDDIRIYNRALSQEEIGAVMSGGGGQSDGFAITRVEYDGTTATITWKSTPGQSYGIDSSEDLERWAEVDDGVAASDAGETTYQDEVGEIDALYYRIRQE